MYAGQCTLNWERLGMGFNIEQSARNIVSEACYALVCGLWCRCLTKHPDPHSAGVDGPVACRGRACGRVHGQYHACNTRPVETPECKRQEEKSVCAGK